MHITNIRWIGVRFNIRADKATILLQHSTSINLLKIDIINRHIKAGPSVIDPTWALRLTMSKQLSIKYVRGLEIWSKTKIIKTFTKWVNQRAVSKSNWNLIEVYDSQD